MKEIRQLNGHQEWGGQARQQRRFYSVYGTNPCIQTLVGDSTIKILEIYEK